MGDALLRRLHSNPENIRFENVTINIDCDIPSVSLVKIM